MGRVAPFPAAPPAAGLYVGRTLHERRAPFTHQFRYRIASLFLDIDRLPEAARQARLFSVDRFNIFSFHRRDHGARADAPLRPWAEAAFAQAGVALEGGPIRLLCFPRVLGYVFNPLSIWFGYGPDGTARGVIYEVHNTFGDQHAYAAALPGAAATPEAQGPAGHAAPKIFHVSPFFPAEGQYRFTLRPPAERFALAIRYALEDREVFIATQTAARTALNDATLARVFVSMPLMTLKVIGAIHGEALRLVMKGARYHRRPPPPAPVSVAALDPSGLGLRAAPDGPRGPV